MSALEQEIVAKFRLLDKEARQRVMQEIERDAGDALLVDSLEPMTPEAWLEWAEAFGEKIYEKYGERRVTSVDLLNEAREERLDDLMGEDN